MTAYSAKDITVLEGLDPVRRRPGMYIGGTGREGLHHLLWELVDNAVDEAMNGHATAIVVTLHADGQAATVEDNGRGIPVDRHKRGGKSALEVILTTLHAGGKFDRSNYLTSGGLHGVGASVVNALSEELRVEVRRDGHRYLQEYRRGEPKQPVREVGLARGSGTTVFFRPDREIFSECDLDAALIAERLEIKTYLNRGLRIIFKDKQAGKTQEFRHDEGIAELVRALVERGRGRAVHAESFLWEGRDLGNGNGDGVMRVETALTWVDDVRTDVRSYVNGIPTVDGGTHERGLLEGVVRALRNYVDTHDLVPRGVSLTAEDFREGLVAVVSVFLLEPQFQGQTKEKLNNPGVRGLLAGAIGRQLEQFLHHNPTLGEAVATRAIYAARARAASRAAAQTVRKKPTVSHRLNLPGKLADCSSTDPRECELFLVEGDSAGGSAKQGRDRRVQAILALRGKVLNAEHATRAKVLANKELSDIVKALGCGFGEQVETSKLRYDRVILLMDADSDGHHISTLLLAFFYRYMRALIAEGHVYVAQPPLYRVKLGKETAWALTDADLERIIANAPGQVKPQISRFKGLGEMDPAVLFETTLDPRRRSLLQVRIDDDAARVTEATMAGLLGRDARARYEFIMANAAEARDLDV
jgi:DNA gyrase subunit B/topoisomerase-4 subunit B